MTRFFDAPQELCDQLETVVSRIENARALVSRLQAAEATLLVEAGELADQIAAHEAHPDGAGMAHRMVASEIGTAVKESDRTVATRMARAVTLVTGYPSVYESFRSGRISAGHTVVITEAGQIIADEEQTAAYEAEVLEFAENETVGRLRPV
ncbi:MAG: HNH endonuclease, partial [Microbacteriaceae bacterium]|nr:HNH endonuclease [Microbacteriaceae bacterium]